MLQQDFTSQSYMFCRESKTSINATHHKLTDTEGSRVRPVQLGPWELHSLQAETLQHGAANPAKYVLPEYQAHNWIKIQGYLSWGQQRHVLGSWALPLPNFKYLP